MTVGELKKQLEGVKDDVEVVIYHARFCKPESKEDYAYYVRRARFIPAGSINNAEFEVEAGKGFGY